MPLGAVADVQLGKMLSATAKTGRGARPYLRNVNVRWHRIDVADVLQMDFDAREVAKFTLERGDVLVCEGGEPGRAAVWRDQLPGALFQKALHRVRLHRDIVEPEFFVYQLELAASMGELARHFTGSTIKHLPRETFIDLPLRIAPIAEQRRIVASLEQHLSALEEARKGLERARSNLVRLRSAIVLSAIPEGEPMVQLGSLLRTMRNGISTKPEGDTGLPILRISAVRPQRVNLQDVRHLPATASDYAGYLLEEGDLLFTRYNGNPALVGVCGVVGPLPTPTVYPDKLIRAQVDTSQLDARYAQVALNAGLSRSFIQARVKTTAGQAGIAGGELRQVPIPLPPIALQRAIAARVELKLSSTERTAAEISVQLARAESLRMALLRRAFDGDLEPRDPSEGSVADLLAHARAGADQTSLGARTSPPRGRRRDDAPL